MEARSLYEEMQKLKDELGSDHDKYGVTKLHYAYTYQEKKREQWTITFNTCFEVAKEYYNRLSRQHSTYDALTPADTAFVEHAPYVTQPAYIVKMIRTTRIADIIAEAENYGRALGILISMDSNLQSIKSQTKNMCNAINEITGLTFDSDDLEEIKTLENLYISAVELHKIDPDDLNELLEKTEELVKGDKLNSLMKLETSFAQNLTNIQPRLERIWTIIRNVEKLPSLIQQIRDQVEQVEKEAEQSVLAKSLISEIKELLPSTTQKQGEA